jgi:hypothetical protein
MGAGYCTGTPSANNSIFLAFYFIFYLLPYFIQFFFFIIFYFLILWGIEVTRSTSPSCWDQSGSS